MLLLKISLKHKEESWVNAKPILEKILEINYKGPEDIPAATTQMMEMFRVFKNIVVQLLKV